MSARGPHELLLAAQHQLSATSSLVSNVDGQPVTTSLKIAAGTGNQHKNVLELVRTYLADLQEFGGVAFQTLPFDTAGGAQNREFAELNEEQSALLLAYMRNSEIVRQFKKALIRDFFNMRRALAAPALPNFADPAAAARAWADEVEAKRAAEGKVQQLEHQVAEQAPAVEGFNLIADASGSLCFRDAAANLKIRQCDLMNYLISKKWIYERVGSEGYKAYGDRLQALDLRYNSFPYESKTTGEPKTRRQVRITNKGLTKLAALIAQDAVAKRLAAGAGQHQQRLPLPGDDG